MTRTTLLSLTLALAMLGLADAWYLAETALTGGELTCTIAGLSGCNVVAQSVYSHLFGIPLGVYGVVFYGIFLILAIAAFVKQVRILDMLLGILGLGGLIASAIFVYIQLALIKALCIYCLGSAAISLFLFLAVAWLVKGSRAPLPQAPAATAPSL